MSIKVKFLSNVDKTKTKDYSYLTITKPAARKGFGESPKPLRAAVLVIV